ncbi:MAG TPA: CBS domain-containing protein [Bacteroidales bacterium]|nr:CBS domain-containing protein [Bacteroidales bacterium]
MTADQLITRDLPPLSISDTGTYALGQMEDLRLGHLPVVDDGRFLGIVSEKDILSMEDPGQEIGTGAMVQKRCFVTEGQHLLEALKTFVSFSLTLLPVVSADHLYLGCVTLPSLLQALSDLTGAPQPGGIIVIDVPEREFDLTEIVQVVEANDARIITCMTGLNPEPGRVRITLKVNRLDIGPLLQAFFRLDYSVVASWSEEDSYNDDLRDRYDALMNFLNI